MGAGRAGAERRRAGGGSGGGGAAARRRGLTRSRSAPCPAAPAPLATGARPGPAPGSPAPRQRPQQGGRNRSPRSCPLGPPPRRRGQPPPTMSRPLPLNPPFLPPTYGVLKSLLENPLKLPLAHEDGEASPGPLAARPGPAVTRGPRHRFPFFPSLRALPGPGAPPAMEPRDGSLGALFGERRPSRPDLTGRARCSHHRSPGTDAKGARCLWQRGPGSPSQALQQSAPGPASSGATGESCGFPGKRRQLGNTRTTYGERIERARKAETEGRSGSSCLLVFPSSTAKRLAGFHRGCCMRLKIKCCEGLVADRKLYEFRFWQILQRNQAFPLQNVH